MGCEPTEGDDNLVLWDFHDLLFHTRSTEGRQANPLGGLYPYADVMPPPPAVRPRWPGKKIDLRKLAHRASGRRSRRSQSCCANVIRHATSTTSNRSRSPNFHSFSTAPRGCSRNGKAGLDLGDGGGPEVDYTTRPYPSGGSAYELELYLAVANCAGLARGFYHYDADRHALVPIGVPPAGARSALATAEFAMDAPGAAADPDHDRRAV